MRAASRSEKNAGCASDSMKTVQFLQQYYCKLFLLYARPDWLHGQKNYDTIFGVSYKNTGSVEVQNANFAIFREYLP